MPLDLATAPELIEAICHRGNGIGADGVVVLEPCGSDGRVGVRYFNRDGSAGALCGNATLCSTWLAVHLGLGSASGMTLVTGDGEVAARLDGDRPSIRLRPVRDLRCEVPGIPMAQGERVGYALVGVPHLVIVTPEVERVDVAGDGPGLRHHPAVGPAGANVNWVQRLPDGRWRYRTYERGVEGETLACGTGAVAVAALLAAWEMTSPDPDAAGTAAAGRGDAHRQAGAPAGSHGRDWSAGSVALLTTSGRLMVVTPPSAAETAAGVGAVLSGEGRVVFRGVISALPGVPGR